jgi:hypothetical protein
LTDYTDKVVKIAKFKYGLDEDIILGYMHHIKFGFENGWTPRRMADYIAHLIF